VTAEQILPAVAKLLQARYLAKWSVYRASIGLPLPKRRRKIKTPPGVIDVVDHELG